MSDIQMGAAEARFADMIWDSEPVTAAQLAKRSGDELQWKKTTAYTVLKRLCEKGIFRNDNGTVTSLIPRQEFYARQSRKFVEDTFDGSLPAFIAAFTRGQRLTPEERDQIRAMIEHAGEE